MLDEFHRTGFKVRALRAEGQRDRGREDGERRDSCAGRDTAIVCLQRRLLRRFPPKHSVLSHEVGE